MKASPLPLGSTVGIVGGGQLGRMLALAAARLGYRTVILEPAEDCPAAQVASRHIVGAYDDLEALEELASASHVLTYEFENVPVGGLMHMARSMPVHPKVKALEVAQDRATEKDFLNAAGIPTADYRAVDSQQELEAALLAFGGDGVLKTRRLGYDGKGQRLFKGDDPAGAFEALGAVPMVLETLVPFVREISVIAARAIDGTFAAYDPAENVHENGILARSTVPAGITAETAERARAHAAALLDKLDYVGVIGIEFFVLPDGGLIANEIAPRVHNSGHWTEAACAVSQFEMHIRAVCGLPLGATDRHSDCVMENLIGNAIAAAPGLLAEAGTVVHLYGKAETRPGRKMGHFTRISPRSSLPIA